MLQGVEMDGEFDDEAEFVFSDSGWAHILEAARELVAAFEIDVDEAEHGSSPDFFPGSSMAVAVPDPHHRRCDAAFARRFLGSTRSLAAKLQRPRALGWGYPQAPLLESVAEELAMWLILQEAFEAAESSSLVFPRRGRMAG